jgi:Trk-type K+ transport system membrane component
MSAGEQIAINPFVVIGGSLSFVVGLAWNDAIQAGIDEYYPLGEKKDTLKAKLLYALIVTIVIVLFALFLDYLNQQSIAAQNAALAYEQARSLSQQYAKS